MPDSKVTDWKAAARALGLDLPETELDRVVAPVAALEAVFRRYAAALTPEVEPAAIFDPSPKDPAA